MSTMHTLNEIDLSLKFTVENLDTNKISIPIVMQLADQSNAYRILQVSKRIESHTANLIDDFSMINDIALNVKKQDELLDWIQIKINKTYIKISDDILECKFKNKWVN